MAITFVNGYQCSNCTDIDNAKKNIDPAHPQDGPYGINAPNKPASGKAAEATGGVNQPAVIYGGSLARLIPVAPSGSTTGQTPSQTPSSQQAAGVPGTGFSLTV